MAAELVTLNKEPAHDRVLATIERIDPERQATYLGATALYLLMLQKNKDFTRDGFPWRHDTPVVSAYAPRETIAAMHGANLVRLPKETDVIYTSVSTPADGRPSTVYEVTLQPEAQMNYVPYRLSTMFQGFDRPQGSLNEDEFELTGDLKIVPVKDLLAKAGLYMATSLTSIKSDAEDHINLLRQVAFLLQYNPDMNLPQELVKRLLRVRADEIEARYAPHDNVSFKE